MIARQLLINHHQLPATSYTVQAEARSELRPHKPTTSLTLCCKDPEYGSVVHWCTGTLVRWDTGTLVQDPGTLVQNTGTRSWYTGTLVQDPGTLVQDPGTLVQNTLVHWYRTEQHTQAQALKKKHES